ncbi:hypothetical protein CF319_g7298 [Tilletia indica]|uniref:Uncharacterized protein n=1 Tax=Tilletia indica TaxID=43049 RepID=A0A177T5D5_9BASI|nr:hypothetical protein CF319_g7298 [Tilletia indica]KAE8230713.1 hypothetical protein CF326_g4283 [Tilletia indica]KAE8244698.1 hypothetical protein A4X13_0g6350 [Tilletia indica]
MPPSDINNGPLVASIPAALQRHINVLQGGHENSGRLSNSLVRLDCIQQTLEHLVQRHNSSLAQELSRLQRDVEEDQARLEHGVAQLRDNFHRLQEDISAMKTRTMDRFATVSLRLSESQAQDFSSVLDQMKSCIRTLGPEVLSAETDLIRVETQLVGLNSWNVAWPEALAAAAQNAQGSTGSPPQYAAPQRSSTANDSVQT